MGVITLKRRDGTQEFDCTACGIRVVKMVDDGKRSPTCACCDWLLSSGLSVTEQEHIRALLGSRNT